MNKEIDMNLLVAVVKQINLDADKKDYTAIEDLLKDIPKKKLIGFLEEANDEEEQPRYIEPYGNTGSDVDYFHSKATTMK